MKMRNYSLAKYSILFVSLLLALTLTASALAQSKPAAAQAAAPQMQLYSMSVSQIKPGMGLEFENFLKKDGLPLMKKAGIKEMTVLKTAGFGVDDTYYFMTPVKSLAELDAPDPVLKALGIDTLALVLPVIERCISSSRTFLFAARPDLGFAPKEGTEIKMGVYVSTSVAPGRNPEYEKAVKEVSAVAAKTNAKCYLMGKVVMGGNPNEYLTYIGVDSFADLEKFGQAFYKGLAEAKLPPESGIVMWSEIFLLREAPELSINPDAK
jgi:hypothetical protein